MIAALLRTKLGVVAMTAFVCLIFFTLSRLKHRKPEEGSKLGLTSSVSGQNSTGGVEQAALLKRTQENAHGRAETSRIEREVAQQSGSSYDEVGNAYRRRATPEPIDVQTTPSRDGTHDPRLDLTTEPLIVPSLRIHGRRLVTNEGATGLLRNPFENLVPDGPSASKDSTQPRLLTTPSKPKPTRFVPYGRLIKAELVITLESTQEEMPLVGLVIEPVYNNGKLIIPAGTELHSMARPDRVRDRIISITTWKMIFPREGQRPNGRQLTFEGMALDREDGDGNGLTWGITDGSYGLRGRSVHSGQTSQEIMLFAAEALRAASSSVMDRQTTIVGSQVEINAKNAGLAGGQAVLENLAKRLSNEIERNGIYIQVPAGKQFYVYPRQVIDPDRADLPDNIARVE